jgi:hypothetical protein
MLVIPGVVEKPDRQLLCRILQDIAPLDHIAVGQHGREAKTGMRPCGRSIVKVEEAGQNPSDWAGAQPVRVW